MGTTPLIGRRFGTLTVLARHDYVGSNARLLCRCDCGNDHVAYYNNLLKGRSRSCGCQLGENIAAACVTHGYARSPKHGGPAAEYRVWKNMKERCLNRKDKDFVRYGARGITVHKRWADDFQAFLLDTGARPTRGHTIERINNDGNYEPGNCRWATRAEQNRNTRRNLYTVVNGTRMTVAEAGRSLGILPSTALSRFHRGVLGDDCGH